MTSGPVRPSWVWPAVAIGQTMATGLLLIGAGLGVALFVVLADRFVRGPLVPAWFIAAVVLFYLVMFLGYRRESRYAGAIGAVAITSTTLIGARYSDWIASTSIVAFISHLLVYAAVLIYRRTAQLNDPETWIRRALSRRECPCCAYDMRALTMPRCPECGATWTRSE